MYDPEDEFRPADSRPSERVSGEYRYKNGYTQRIYSDAHYTRAGESTDPPRYYTPPEKPVKEPRPARQKGVGLGGMIALCLICALLGGLCGGAYVSSSLDRRFDQLEESMNELSESSGQAPPSSASAAAAEAGIAAAESGTAEDMNAGDIYDLACRQVVGVSTEVTGTNFFGMPVSGAVTGTGFIISSDGYIITNYHVIEDAYKGRLDVTVMLHDGTSYKAEIVGTEPDNDIAVLRIDAEGLNAAVIGDSDALRVGDTVYAVGNPLGELEFSMTTGHVSAKDRVIKTENGAEAIAMFQVDAPVNSGNSGGPVYNGRGEVVGVVTAKYSSSGVEGIGFAIPINDAASIARDLVTNGYVTGKARLGVTVNSKYSEMYAQYYGWPLGAYIDGVEKGSCAERAGIEAGDIITRLGEEDVRSYEDLRSAIRRHSAGETVEIEVYHADESRTVAVVLDEETPG